MSGILNSFARLLGRKTACESDHPEIISIINQAIGIIPLYQSFVKDGFRDKRVLEIGPGRELGIALAFAGLGASVIAIDKYPVQWDEEFHAPLYSMLLKRIKETFPEFDTRPLKEVLRNRTHQSSRLLLVENELERVPSIESASIDISFSNATLEHLHNHAAAIAELGRVTKHEGIGFHQVDMRDHRFEFTLPLEYLTVEPDQVSAVLANGSHLNYFGSTPRASQYVSFFESAGFSVSVDANMSASKEEISRVRPKLKAPFDRMSDEDIGIISARFHIVKTG